MLELRIPPVAVFLICAVVMWVMSTALPTATFVLPAASAVFGVLAIIGGGIGIAGVGAFRRHSTTVDPTAPDKTKSIVRDGVYQYSRNPMYVALAVALAGWGLFLENIAALLVLPLFIAYMTLFQIKPEERVLLARFGTDYDEYMASVRRWI